MSRATTSQSCSARPVARVARRVLVGAREEPGGETMRPRRREVAVMRRHHHHLGRRQVEQRAGAEIGLRVGLVVTEQVAAEHHVPRQAGMFGEIGQQRDVAVRERGDDEPPLQPRQPRHGIRPRSQPVPEAGDLPPRRLVQPGDAELADQPVQRLAMQHIERCPGAFAVPHPVHRRHIGAAPGIDQRRPVGREAACGAEIGQVLDQAAAPIDHRAEHVENQRLHVHRLPSRPRARSGIAWPCPACAPPMSAARSTAAPPTGRAIRSRSRASRPAPT